MKRIWTILTALLLSLAFALPAMAELQDMWAYVYRDTGKVGADGRIILTKAESGITFVVLAVDSNTAETITYYGKSTSLANPVTTTSFASVTICNKMVSFRVDPTDATYDQYVDLIVTDTIGGYSRVIKGFDKYTHSIVIDERPNIMHHGLVWFGGAAVSNVETSTGVSFVADTFIHDVRPEVVTVASGLLFGCGLLSTETSGVAAGFRTGMLLTTAGYPSDTGVVTNGSSIDYTAASTYGSLLYTAITGSDAITSGGGRSFIGHVVRSTNAHTLSYTATSSTAYGYIHYWFTRMR
jgi:hypothetical protein